MYNLLDIDHGMLLGTGNSSVLFSVLLVVVIIYPADCDATVSDSFYDTTWQVTDRQTRNKVATNILYLGLFGLLDSV